MVDTTKVKVHAKLTDGREIHGSLSIPQGGYRSRVTDLLNNDKQFISLKNVSIYQGPSLNREEVFVALNKNEIITLSIDDYKDTEM